MLTRRHASLVILALAVACGATPDGSDDTSVGDETRTAAAAAAAAATPVDSPPAELLGFPGKGRFVVFGKGDVTRIWDASGRTRIELEGRPLTTLGGDAYSVWFESGANANVLPTAVTNADGSRMLVRVRDAIAAVDLADGGKTLAKVGGQPLGASIAPDGKAFVAWTADAVHLARLDDGTVMTIAVPPDADRDLAVGWTARAVVWRAADTVHLIDRLTWRDEHLTETPGTRLETRLSTEGNLVLASETRGATASVRVFRMGEPVRTPALASGKLEDVVFDEAAAQVVWTERTGRDADGTAIHALDLDSGIHVRFPAASRCFLATERLVSLSQGLLHTDAACSPGCPSIRWESDFVTYDVATGAVKGRERIADARAHTEDVHDAAETMTAASARLGIPSTAMIVMAGGTEQPPLVLFGDDGAVTLASVTDPLVKTSLANSAGFVAETLRGSQDGSIVAGASSEGLAVWDARTGSRIFAEAW